MGFLKEFRDFALKGNVLDMAVGVIIGVEFGKIVNSMINDLIMPAVGQIVGKVDFSDLKFILQPGVVESKDAGGKVLVAAVPEVAIRYGQFVTVAINFFILAICVFLVVKAFNAARRRFEREAPPPAPPAGPTNEEKLLMEIRDLLKAR